MFCINDLHFMNISTFSYPTLIMAECEIRLLTLRLHIRGFNHGRDSPFKYMPVSVYGQP